MSTPMAAVVGPAGVGTHCPCCALQRGMTLRTRADGWPEVLERLAFPVNKGALCEKGRTATEVLPAAVRLTEPAAPTAHCTRRAGPTRWTGPRQS